ncbi:hypothetical protein [Peribacillus alkalitolerans]|uniref:hypothetical protein n=1 Tax=Peribacillus alkalitolerans TaxID=1550385 RepID=UPI0013D06230|nr:hypothetical protein [Peribacillus alkalitolerans]
MRRIHPLVIAFFSVCTFILSSFSSLSESSSTALPRTENKQLLFVTSKDKYMLENEYYDALIELKDKFPKETNQMVVIEADSKKFKETSQLLNHIQAPAIVIMENRKIKLEIQGVHTNKEVIVEKIHRVLEEEHQKLEGK